MITERITNVNELKDAVNSAVGHMICASLFDGKNIYHYYFASDFPENDMLRSLGKMKNLVVEHLEKPVTTPQRPSNPPPHPSVPYPRQIAGVKNE